MSHSEDTSKKKNQKMMADIMTDIETEASLFLTDSDDETEIEALAVEARELEGSEVEGSELEVFESAQIEDLQFIEDEQLESIIESIFFASDRPVSLAAIQLVFKGTNVKKEKIRRTIETLAVEYAGGRRGIVLEEITGGYQIRTKVDNMNFLKTTVKNRPFKLSGPALETLAIVAYKQPTIKLEIDQIRGVESGHLLRALMEKGIVTFEGKAESLPGKPMQYGTTRKFLEIFGLRNLKELPTLSQIDELLPEGIGEEIEDKATLAMVTDSLSADVKVMSYSQGEEELGMIEDQLTAISTSSDFFEQEKVRQRLKRDEEKAQNIRECLLVGEEVSKRDLNWLKKHEEVLTLDSAGETQLTGAQISNDVTDAGELAAGELAFLEEDAAHVEDEIPFEVEADEDGSSEEGHA